MSFLRSIVASKAPADTILIRLMVGAIFLIDMLVANATTKVPILMESGFWKMAHEARTDYAMLLGSAFLLIVGSGRLGLDAAFAGETGLREG